MADINQIIDPKVIEDLKKMNEQLVAAGTNMDKLIPSISELNKQTSAAAKNTGDNAGKQKQLTEAEKEQLAIQKQIEKNEAKINALNSEAGKLLTKKRLELQQATQAQKEAQKVNEAAEGSLVRMRAKLKELTAEYDKSGNRTKAATQEINKLSREIGKAEEATNRHQRNVGNYTSVWDKFKNVASGLPGPLGNAAGAAEGLVTKIASLGPVGGIVAGTIVAAGVQLAAFFTKSEAGAEMLERKFAGLKASFSVLVGELIDGGAKIAEEFDKPEKQSTFWTSVLSFFGPGAAGIGVRMDLAGTAAQNYTRQMQELEDLERGMIVPRAEANKQIKAAMLLYQDETKTIDVRMNALKNAIALENKTADAEIKHQRSVVENIRTINAEKEKASQLRNEDDLKLQNAMAKEIELSTESMGRQIRAAARINTARDEILSGVKKQSEAEKKLSDERIKKWADETWAKAQAINEEKKLNEMYLSSFAELINEETKLRDKQLEDDIAASIAAGEKILEEKQKLSEKEKDQRIKNEEDFKQAAIQQGTELGNYLFDSKKKQLELEFQAAEGNAEKQAAIKRKIAQSDKKQALFNIAVNTAVAISKVLGQTGILGLAAWIPIAALGAVQAAMVLAQKVPEFAKGTNFAPGGPALVAEEGPELIKSPGGRVYLANNPALVNLERGSKVLTNQKTEAFLNDGNIVSELRQTRKAIQRIPQPIFLNGSKIAERRNGYWKEYLNAKHRSN